MSSIIIELKGKDGATPVIGKASDDIVKKVQQLSSKTQNTVKRMALNFTSGLGGAIGKVGRTLTSLKTLALGALAGWGLEKLASSFIDTASSIEGMKLSLDTITKGKGEEWFKELNEWALKMPVNTEKAIKSFTMMQAMGLKPTIDQMTVLVDTMGALGGNEDAMEGISRALGQIATKGKVSAEELMQLAERGVPVFEILKEKFGDVETSSLDARKAIAAIFEGLEERFGGQAEKMQGTWGGMIETLKSYWKEFQRLVMESGIFEAIKDQLGGVIARIDEMYKSGELEQWAKKTAESVMEMGNVTVKVVAKIVEAIGWLPTAVFSVKEAVNKTLSFLAAMGAKVVDLMAVVALAADPQSSWKLGARLGKGMDLSEALRDMFPALAKARDYFDDLGVSQYSAALDSSEMAQKFADFGVKMEGIASKIRNIKFETKDLKKELNSGAGAGASGLIAGITEQSADQLTQTVKQAATGTIAELKRIAEEDKQTLEGRLIEYTKFYSQLEGMIKKNSEQEKKHIQELSDIYQKKADAQRTAEELIRGLREIGMSAAEKYESSRSALSDQYMSAMRLSGQEQIDALEKYKSAVASLAKEHGDGIKETISGISGETERLAVSGKQIIDAAVTDIQNATVIQTQAFRAIEAEKERQIEQDRIWGNTLRTTANEAAGEINYLQTQVGALSAEIDRMNKLIELEGEDYVSPVIDQIQRNLENLRSNAAKPVVITTIHRDIFQGDSAGGLNVIDSYRTGTDYVPRTGLYQLHRGEAVLPPEAAEEARAAGVLGVYSRNESAAYQTGIYNRRVGDSAFIDEGAGENSDNRAEKINTGITADRNFANIFNAGWQPPVYDKQKNQTSTVEFKGDINIILPENTPTRTVQDWRLIVREEIIPELKKAKYM